MFFRGISVREVRKIIGKLFKGEWYISGGTVSKIAKSINEEVNKWLNKKIEDKYEIILLDGVYLKLRSPINSKRRVVLVAYGIDRDGIGEVIGYKVASYGESEQAWSNFINELYHRGLEGKELKLCVIDGNAGLKNGIELVWPKARIQRCWVHKMRNIINYFPYRYREEVSNDLRRIYEAKSKTEALNGFKEFKNKWFRLCVKGTNCLEKDLDDMVVYFEVLNELSIKDKGNLIKWIKTTNRIERVFREVRRRTDSIGAFTNKDSLIRIMYKVFKEYNEKQEEKRKKIKKYSGSFNQIYTHLLT
jgi:putative transposase